MSSMVWLGLAVILVATVAVLGSGPKGGKPVAQTSLMKTARVALIGGVVVCAALGIVGAIGRH
jgi:hypothetical protein